MALRIKNRKFETACFQPHVIEHQPTAFKMEYFQAITISVHENENFPISDITPHGVGDNSAKGIKTFAHIGGMRVKPKSHVAMQMKHMGGLFY